MRFKRMQPPELITMLAKQPDAFVEAMLKANCFLAYEGDELIGMTAYTLDGNVLTVQYLKIRDSLKRQGWGLKILKELEEIAICNNCNEMFLVYKDKALEPFYDKATALIPMLICEYREYSK